MYMSDIYSIFNRSVILVVVGHTPYEQCYLPWVTECTRHTIMLAA